MHRNNPFESMDKRIAKERRRRSITLMRDTGDKVVESIGRTFRATLQLPESSLSDTNRRAGRTALVAGFLAAGSVIMLGQCAEPVECRTFAQQEFMVDDPNVLATQIAQELDAYASGDSGVFDGIQAELFDKKSVEICGTHNIQAVDKLTVKL